jgi:hypothetical protein
MTIIDRLLSAAQARLSELDREAEHLRALIRLYAGTENEQNAQTTARPSEPDAKGRTRGISPAWKPLGAYLIAAGERHLDELDAFSQEQTLGFSRVQIRNQMHNWKRRGFVESPRTSVFVITPAGAEEMAENGSPNNNGANHGPAPLPDFENGDEPQSLSNARFGPVEP